MGMGIRKIFRTIFYILFAIVFLPLLSEFVIEIARERGFFEHPTSKAVMATEWLTNNEYFWVILSFVVGGAITLYIYNLLPKENIEASKENRKLKKPNYDAWDHVQDFYLFQLGYLWNDQEPGDASGNMGGKVYSWFSMLKSAIRNNELIPSLTLDEGIKFKQRDFSVINKNTRVSKAELRKFAEAKGFRPPFLFPEDRGGLILNETENAIAGKPIKQTAKYDTPIHEAIMYVARKINDNDANNFFEHTRNALRQAAVNGEITFWGRKEIDGKSGHCDEIYTPIDQSYWDKHILNEMATDANYEAFEHTKARNLKKELHRNRYWGLRVDIEEIKKRWY